jgi:hypothetical protein
MSVDIWSLFISAIRGRINFTERLRSSYFKSVLKIEKPARLYYAPSMSAQLISLIVSSRWISSGLLIFYVVKFSFIEVKTYTSRME